MIYELRQFWYHEISKYWCLKKQKALWNALGALLRSLERAAAGIGLYVNAYKIEYMCFKQTDDISTLNSSSLKLVYKLIYLGSSVSSIETDINMRLAKAWTFVEGHFWWCWARPQRAPRGLFWTSIRSMTLEKEQWQTWGL